MQFKNFRPYLLVATCWLLTMFNVVAQDNCDCCAGETFCAEITCDITGSSNVSVGEAQVYTATMTNVSTVAYKVFNASNAVIASGTASKSGNNYSFNYTFNSNGEFRIEFSAQNSTIPSGCTKPSNKLCGIAVTVAECPVYSKYVTDAGVYEEIVGIPDGASAGTSANGTNPTLVKFGDNLVIPDGALIRIRTKGTGTLVVRQRHSTNNQYFNTQNIGVNTTDFTYFEYTTVPFSATSTNATGSISLHSTARLEIDAVELLYQTCNGPCTTPTACTAEGPIDAAVNEEVTFVSSGGEPADIVFWNAPGGNPSSGTGNTATTSFDQPGNQTVTFYNYNSSIPGDCGQDGISICEGTVKICPVDNTYLQGSITTNNASSGGTPVTNENAVLGPFDGNGAGLRIAFQSGRLTVNLTGYNIPAGTPFKVRWRQNGSGTYQFRVSGNSPDGAWSASALNYHGHGLSTSFAEFDYILPKANPTSITFSSFHTTNDGGTANTVFVDGLEFNVKNCEATCPEVTGNGINASVVGNNSGQLFNLEGPLGNGFAFIGEQQLGEAYFQLDFEDGTVPEGSQVRIPAYYQDNPVNLGVSVSNDGGSTFGSISTIDVSPVLNTYSYYLPNDANAIRLHALGTGGGGELYIDGIEYNFQDCPPCPQFEEYGEKASGNFSSNVHGAPNNTFSSMSSSPGFLELANGLELNAGDTLILFARGTNTPRTVTVSHSDNPFGTFVDAQQITVSGTTVQEYLYIPTQNGAKTFRFVSSGLTYLDAVQGHAEDCSGVICNPTETNETTCNDGIDNDCDQLIDEDDPDCNGCTPTPGQQNQETNCSDFIDNDCDGLTDGNDPDCQTDPNCTVDVYITGNNQPSPNTTETYSASLQNSSGTVTYNWTVSGGTISGSSTQSSVTVNWGAEGSGYIAVDITDGSNCSASDFNSVNIKNCDQYPAKSFGQFLSAIGSYSFSGPSQMSANGSVTVTFTCSNPIPNGWHVGGLGCSPCGGSTGCNAQMRTSTGGWTDVSGATSVSFTYENWSFDNSSCSSSECGNGGFYRSPSIQFNICPSSSAPGCSCAGGAFNPNTGGIVGSNGYSICVSE